MVWKYFIENGRYSRQVLEYWLRCLQSTAPFQKYDDFRAENHNLSERDSH